MHLGTIQEEFIYHTRTPDRPCNIFTSDVASSRLPVFDKSCQTYAGGNFSDPDPETCLAMS